MCSVSAETCSNSLSDPKTEKQWDRKTWEIKEKQWAQGNSKFQDSRVFVSLHNPQFSYYIELVKQVKRLDLDLQITMHV